MAPFDYRLKSIFEQPDVRSRLGLPALDTSGELPPVSPVDAPAPATSPAPAPAAADDLLPKNVAEYQDQKATRAALLAQLKDAQAEDTKTRFFNTLGAAFNQAGNAFSGRNRAPIQAPVTAVKDMLAQHQLGAALDQEARANAAEGRAAQMFGPQFEAAKAKAQYAGDEAASDAAMKRAHAALYNQQATEGAADLEESETQRREAHDPQSLTSQIGLQVAQQAGIKVPPGTPFAAYSNLLPLATKSYIAEKTLEARQAALAAGAQRFEQTHGEKREQFDTKREDALSKGLNAALDPYASRGGLKGRMDIIDRATRLRATVGKTLNLDRRQVEELAIGLNALLSGSSAGAQRQVEALVPQSTWGDVQKLKERITNEPTGLGQQAFVQKMLDTIIREEETTRSTVRDAVKARLPEFAPLRELNRDRYESILRARGFDPELFDEKGLEKGAASSGSASVEPRPRRTVNGETREWDGKAWVPIAATAAR